MMTIQTVTVNLVLVCFVGGFFLGLGYSLGAWVTSRIVTGFA